MPRTKLSGNTALLTKLSGNTAPRMDSDESHVRQNMFTSLFFATATCKKKCRNPS